MDWFRILISRCAALFRRQKLDADLDEELHSHIDFATEEHRKHGLTEQEARTAALREFGGVTQIKEQYRVRRGMPFVEQMVRDLRYGCRQLGRSPGFTITAVLTLALGLGANTAIFSLVNALVLRPLPVPHAEQLAVLHYDRSDGNGPYPYSFSAPLFRALEKRHEVFRDVAAFSSRDFLVRGGSGTVKVAGAMVSGQFFSAMETPPLMGRTLTPQDDQPGGGSTGFGVVISEGFWRTWFNGAPNVVGRKLVIANAPFTVVGVMPKRFIGADPTWPSEIYAPLWSEPVIDAPYNSIANGYHSHWMTVIARNRPGISLQQVNAALMAASNPILEEAVPDTKWVKDEQAHHFHFAADPGSGGYTYLRSGFIKPLVAVTLLCAAMLLLACLNLASLLMARSAARERELATRLAMGATRRRLVQQLLVESALTALMGTAAGLLTAPLVSHSLAVMLLGHSRYLDTALDLRVYAFAAVTAVAVVLLIGLAPALRATANNLNEQIKHGSHVASARERRRVFPRILMGLEVALALMLVVGAGLLATSLVRLYQTGLGFDPKDMANLDLDMNKQALDGDALTGWYRRYGEALSRLPGVKGVSFQSVMPISGTYMTDEFRTSFSGGDHTTYMNIIAPDYFRTLRIPILAGREFQWEDNSTAEAKIVLSQSAARKLFPGQDAVGQKVTGHRGKSYRVIGVAGDIHYMSIREAAAVGAYVPISQVVWSKASYTAVVRLDGPAAPLADAARILAARMAPDVPAPVMTTMSSVLDASISSERMMAMLAVFFAVCALLVTAIGLYGTLAYATARRTSEIGIRMALGARRAQVVGLVFRENASVVAGGSLAGLAIALLASRALASFLYGISVHDPWVLVESVAALTLIASAASLVPAVRAARIDPIQALRAE